MRHRLSYIFIFLILVSSFSCKRKYEEGPLISFNSKCNRIEREWTLQYFFIDNIDLTNSVYSALGILDNRFRVKMIKPKEGNCRGYARTLVKAVITSGSPYSTYYYGTYSLSDDGEYLETNFMDTDGYTNLNVTPVGPLFTNGSLRYRIKRLTKDELWLEINYNGKNVWCHFKS